MGQTASATAAAFGLSASLVMAGSALSDPAADEQSFAASLFGQPPGKAASYACFTRVYTNDHLARHPAQNVRNISLLVKGLFEGPSYKLGLSVEFRGRRPVFGSTGVCGSIGDDSRTAPSTVHCDMACDGGTIDVTLKDGRTVLVAIPDTARLGAEDMVDGTELLNEPKRFGADDKLFRLDRAPLSACLPIAGDEVEKAALRRQ